MSKYDAYIVGYYGMQNSGDDALLLSALYGAKKILNCNKILISSFCSLSTDKFGSEVSLLKEKQNFKGQNRLIHYYNSLRSKRVIFGGGSVLHTAKDIDQKRMMMKLSNPSLSMALGVGIEPFTYLDDEISCRNFLNECGLVAVRDQASYDIAQWIAPYANVIKAFDLAPSLLSLAEIPSNSNRQGIALNLCPKSVDAFGNLDVASENKRTDQICQFITKLYKETRREVTLFSFNGHPQKGDHYIHENIKKRLEGIVPISLIGYEPDPIKVINKISGFEVVIGMRLHFNIFAYMTNTPCIAINYHPKSYQWCKQVGIPNDYQFNASNIDSDMLLVKTLELISSSKPTASMPLKSAVENALFNWSKGYAKA